MIATDTPSSRPGSKARMERAFNLFRRKESPELYCAVPEDRAVPTFIAGDAWEFGGKVSEVASDPPGFDAKNADAGARLNGFYLFQIWPQRQERAQASRR